MNSILPNYQSHNHFKHRIVCKQNRLRPLKPRGDINWAAYAHTLANWICSILRVLGSNSIDVFLSILAAIVVSPSIISKKQNPVTLQEKSKKDMVWIWYSCAKLDLHDRREKDGESKPLNMRGDAVAIATRKVTCQRRTTKSCTCQHRDPWHNTCPMTVSWSLFKKSSGSYVQIFYTRIRPGGFLLCLYDSYVLHMVRWPIRRGHKVWPKWHVLGFLEKCVMTMGNDCVFKKV